MWFLIIPLWAHAVSSAAHQKVNTILYVLFVFLSAFFDDYKRKLQIYKPGCYLSSVPSFKKLRLEAGCLQSSVHIANVVKTFDGRGPVSRTSVAAIILTDHLTLWYFFIWKVSSYIGFDIYLRAFFVSYIQVESSLWLAVVVVGDLLNVQIA